MSTEQAPHIAILNAANFAAIKHSSQRRKDKEQTPYINHAIGVAQILAQEGGVVDPIVLQAALLHDTVEDTDTTLTEISELFGDKVAAIVAEVTSDMTLVREERKRLQVESAPSKSPEAKLIKMADKLYNLRDLRRQVPVGWTAERVRGYFEWSKRVTDSCAHVNPRLAAALDELYKKLI